MTATHAWSARRICFEKKVKKKSYNGFYRYFSFLPVFDQFEHEVNSVLSIIESQLGLRHVGDMKAILGPCLGVTGSLTGSVLPTLLQKYDYTAKLGMRKPKNST